MFDINRSMYRTVSRFLILAICAIALVIFAVAVLAQKKQQGRTGKAAPEFEPKVNWKVPNQKRSPTTSTTKAGSTKASRNARMRKAQGQEFRPEISRGETVAPVDFTGDLRHLPREPITKRTFAAPLEKDIDHPQTKQPMPGVINQQAPVVDLPALLAPMPTPGVSFKGLDFQTWGAGWPPDTVGDVGPNHYVQAVNTAVGIYDKTGTEITAFTFNDLFNGTGTACDNDNRGDPTVVFDRMGGHWFVSDFAYALPGTTPPFFQCIAVSKGNNPVTSGWWLYAIRTDDAAHPWFADYPKMGIWHDALYMTANMFLGSTFQEVRVWAFNRADLESGAPVRTVIADLGTPTFFSLLPANVRGLAPVGSRPQLLISQSLSFFAFEVFKFTVNFNGPGSTFTGVDLVSQTSYTAAPATVTSPGNNLDSIRERLMMQAQYRKLGATESLWVQHTVRTGASPAPAGIQWAQIDVTGGTIVTPPVQQGIYGDVGADGVHRWMGSLAVDGQGNMALGFSASRDTLAPDVRYVGRLAGDPLNTLPQTEVSLIPAAVVRGSQTGNCGGPCQRWGDYSSMSVDPTDDCTFWYTNMYYETSGLNWQTRIGSFKFPGCLAGPTAAPASISGVITTPNDQALAGVVVRLEGGSSATAITDANGRYRFDRVETDNFYTVTPTLANYRFSPTQRSFSLNGNRTDAAFTASPESAVGTNAIDTNEFFVRQQYLDFLGREPDQSGFDYWSAQLNQCGDEPACLNARRIRVSAAFFVEQEFQRTGSFIYRLYKGALGRQLSYAEFSADRSHVVEGPGLEASKTAFANSFVGRSEFVTRYENTTSAASFVDALLATISTSGGADLTDMRSALIAKYNTGANMSQSRALVLLDIGDNPEFARAVYNRVFVLMEYFGYLHRDPDAGGYTFWLDVLENREPGNYRGMVCSFLTSAEYQRRFSSVVTRSNADCR